MVICPIRIGYPHPEPLVISEIQIRPDSSIFTDISEGLRGRVNFQGNLDYVQVVYTCSLIYNPTTILSSTQIVASHMMKMSLEAIYVYTK